jgi:hypothetical protein
MNPDVTSARKQGVEINSWPCRRRLVDLYANKGNDMRHSARAVALIVLLCCHQLATALEPTVRVDVETPQRPVVNGKTNLPNGTKLIISVTRKEASYNAQDSVKVADGQFRTARFSQKGVDLSPGKYSVEVLMPFPAVQSDAVRAVIGERGEKLTGPLIKHEKLGNLVKQVSTFQVGRGNADAKADAAAREQENKDSEKWVRRSCNDMLNNAEQLRQQGKLTGKALNAAERKAEFDRCIKEISSKKK